MNEAPQPSPTSSPYAADRLDRDALVNMIGLELQGEKFYLALAERIEHPEAAELLRRNGREEAGHARRLGRAIEILQGEPYAHAGAELPEIPLPPTISRGLFDQIVKAELEGDVGYQRWAANEPNEEIARLLQLNGREETIHSERISKVLELLNPA